MELITDRLVLRPFREEDRRLNVAIFGDRDVRRYSLGVLDQKSADERLDRFVAELQQAGYGMLAVEDRSDCRFIGTLGLTGFGSALKQSIPSRSKIQIAWQLAQDVWGRGYATEGARAILSYAFRALRLDEIVAITADISRSSRRVMERSGCSTIRAVTSYTLTFPLITPFRHMCYTGSPCRIRIGYYVSASLKAMSVNQR